MNHRKLVSTGFKGAIRKCPEAQVVQVIRMDSLFKYVRWVRWVRIRVTVLGSVENLLLRLQQVLLSHDRLFEENSIRLR